MSETLSVARGHSAPPSIAAALVALFSVGLVSTTAATVALTVVDRSPTPPTVRTSAAAAQSESKYAGLPLGFEPNVGQTSSRVQFIAHGQESTTWLAPTTATVSSHGTGYVMHLVGANPRAVPTTEDGLPGVVNYLTGSDESQWHTSIPTFGKVVYHDVYPGIDVAYHGTQGALEYDFIVAPGANPARIALRMDGATTARIDVATGDLLVNTAAGTMRQHAPALYQDVVSGRQRIPGRFLNRGMTVGFMVGSYDHSRPLVIDPKLVYSTYLGGTPPPHSFDGNDWGMGVAADSTGDVYIVGRTASGNFPTTAGALQTTNISNPSLGGFTAFVSKIDTSRAGVASLVYSTFLGGTRGDYATAVALDRIGEAFITGVSYSPDFPTTKSAFQSLHPQQDSAFIAKLNATGTKLLYSTFLGGSVSNGVFFNGTVTSGIAVDSLGRAYVTGLTYQSDFPVTAGSFQTACPDLLSGSGCATSFVTEMNARGSKLVYSTFLGAVDSNPNDYYFADYGNGIAVDASGDAYVTGETFWYATPLPLFPTTPGAFQTVCPQATANGGCDSAFVAKLNPTGSALVYSTYLAGSCFDAGEAIAVDAHGSAYVAGTTCSRDYPTTSGAFQTTPAQAFLTKLNPAGTGLVYSTYFPGAIPSGGLAIDTAGDAYVTGSTGGSTTFPTTAAAFQTTARGNGDAFVSKLNPSGSNLLYSTYLGGSAYDSGSAVAVDPLGRAYVAGVTSSSDFPTTTGAFQRTFAGGSFDAFVSAVDPTGAQLAYSSYLGGSPTPPTQYTGFDISNSIAVDNAGDAYVTGCTESADFPTTSGALQTSNPAHAAFVTKLNPAGSGLVYSTYLGPVPSPQCGLGGGARGIAIDGAGHAVVTGVAGSSSFPTTAGAYDTTSGADFVTELNATGTGLIYSTLLPGGDVHGIASGPPVAPDGPSTVYLTGSADSTFPTTPGAYQSPCAGGGYVLRLNPAGNGAADLAYSTCGVGGGAIAVDSAGIAYVSGGAAVATPGAFQTTGPAGATTAIAKLNPAGGGSSDLMYSTFFGDTISHAQENTTGLALGPPTPGSSMPTIYITGNTHNVNLPLTPSAYQTTNTSLVNCGSNNGGCGRAFVAQINPAGTGLSDLRYSTYIGGTVWDVGLGIAVDAGDHAVITGFTISPDYPTTKNAVQKRCGCNAFHFQSANAFISVLDPTASGAAQLVFSTFFGGGGGDIAFGVALDGQDNAYVTGFTGSSPQADPRTHTPGFPITRGAFQPLPGGGGDAFVAKISDL